MIVIFGIMTFLAQLVFPLTSLARETRVRDDFVTEVTSNKVGTIIKILDEL